MAVERWETSMYLQAVLSIPQGSASSFSNSTARSIYRRGPKRRSLTLSASASLPRGSEVPALIRDISPGGILIQADAGTLAIDDEVTLNLADDTTIRARVAWTSERLFGCEFKTPISVATVSAALLRAEPQSRAAGPGNRPLADSGKARGGFLPEANFSVALLLGISLWAAGGAAMALVL